ncbi:MAG: signal transduction histidine kinase, nitrogen specific, NtrB [Myxococcaceae bacterium]|nr:signal transduction histidine kinase, nitrogen specific, NtrB [Myxococcaceae bacterium]
MLRGSAMGADLANDRQRARFEAVRRRVFEEMQDAASRKRTTFMVPFQIIVVAILAARGAPPVRLGIQIAAFVTCLFAMSIVERVRGPRGAIAFMVASVCVLVTVGNTGGLASPLLLSVVPFLVINSMNPNLDHKRYGVLAFFLLGFIVMALGSHTAIGELILPLASNIHWASSEYVAISFVSAIMAVLSIFKIGRAISGAYERIALELAVRREELCDESEGRTRALEGIAARLAHEVKNPLAAIKGLSTHVARSSTDEKVRERLTIVASEAERLQEIVEGFLSFSRGLDDLTVGPTKPYEIARELSLLLETRAADAGVTLEVRGSRELSLNADDKKLRQALLNLVLNAMQASVRGTTVTLEVAKSCSDGAAVVRIMDRGAGMAPEVLDRIRKPYYTTKEGGSGLGIAVARGIIEQHGGSLRFESTSGRGTTATVHLPACALMAQSKKAKLPNPCHASVAAAGAAVVAAVTRHTPEKVTS